MGTCGRTPTSRGPLKGFVGIIWGHMWIDKVSGLGVRMGVQGYEVEGFRDEKVEGV